MRGLIPGAGAGAGEFAIINLVGRDGRGSPARQRCFTSADYHESPGDCKRGSAAVSGGAKVVKKRRFENLTAAARPFGSRAAFQGVI